MRGHSINPHQKRKYYAGKGLILLPLDQEEPAYIPKLEAYGDFKAFLAEYRAFKTRYLASIDQKERIAMFNENVTNHLDKINFDYYADLKKRKEDNRKSRLSQHLLQE